MGEVTSSAACGLATCGHLAAANDRVCFYGRLPSTWQHLAILMNHTSAEADADLFGYLVNDAVSTQYPSGQDAGASFSDQATTLKASTYAKADFATYTDHFADGLFLCVTNRAVHQNGNATTSGPVDFRLHASATACPSEYTPDGVLLQCSTPVGEESSPTAPSQACAGGACVCNLNFLPPTLAPPDAGFDRCAAKVVDNTRHGPSDAAPLNLRRSYEQRVHTTTFVKMAVPAGFSQIVALAEVEDVVGAQLVLTLRRAELPGRQAGQYDARSAQYDHITGMNDRFVSAPTDGAAADWWVGIYVATAPAGRSAVRYDLGIESKLCENDCSSRGKCVEKYDEAGLYHVCECDEGRFLPDCSGHSTALALGVPRTGGGRGGSLSFWQLPQRELDSMGTLSDLQVVVSVTNMLYDGYGAYDATAQEVGEVLLQIGNATAFPTEDSFAMRQPLLRSGATTLHVCDSLVPMDSVLSIGVRVLDPSLLVNYTLVVAGVESCRAGALRADALPNLGGTCWRKCMCQDGQCKFAAACEHASCFAPGGSADAAGYRYNSKQNQCVQDQCTQDTWTEADGHVCLIRCECPISGEGCRKAPGCDGEHVVCKSGFVRDPGGARCLKEQLQSGSDAGAFGWVLVSFLACLGGWAGHAIFVHGLHNFRFSMLWKRPSHSLGNDGYFELTHSTA